MHVVSSSIIIMANVTVMLPECFASHTNSVNHGQRESVPQAQQQMQHGPLACKIAAFPPDPWQNPWLHVLAG